MNAKETFYGSCTIYNANFVNNTSECGTVLNLSYLNPGDFPYILVENTTFTHNIASKFGGVIYSLGEHNACRLSFKNCTFNDNHADSGNIIYTHSKNNLPEIKNLKETDISTIPEHFEIDGDEEMEISIISGESIPEGMKCKLNKL